MEYPNGKEVDPGKDPGTTEDESSNEQAFEVLGVINKEEEERSRLIRSLREQLKPEPYKAGKKTKGKVPQRRVTPEFGTRPTRERSGRRLIFRADEEGDIRERPAYEIPFMQDRFCPKSGYRAFIRGLDCLLALDDEAEKIRAEVDKVVTSIYKVYGLENPRRDHRTKMQFKLWSRIVNSYRALRDEILTADVSKHKHSSFKFKMAALEVLGCLIINPSLTNHCCYNYSDGGMTTPYLETNFFTTNWTSSRVDRIIWKPGAMGVILLKKEQEKVEFGLDLDSDNDDKDPDKDLTIGFEMI